MAPLCFCDEGDGGGGKDDDGCKKVLAAITKVGELRETERFLPVVDGIVKTNIPELQVRYNGSIEFLLSSGVFYFFTLFYEFGII